MNTLLFSIKTPTKNHHAQKEVKLIKPLLFTDMLNIWSQLSDCIHMQFLLSMVMVVGMYVENGRGVYT